MNQFSRRTAVENEFPQGTKNIVGKASLLPPLTNKSRPFGDVANLTKTTIGRSSAIERQRANAEKLSKGYSVVPSKKSGEKEGNEATKEKPRQPLRVIGKENTGISSRSSTANLAKPLFRVPAKPLKQKKPTQILQKSASVTSLQTDSTTTRAAELANALQSLIVDDDKKCENDEFLLGIYAKDIYKYLRALENEQNVRKNYLSSNHIMTAEMRAVLVDWMFEVQQSFDLLQDTTQMAITLLDRFLQDQPRVAKEELQLVGVTCIFIAAKYEEMYPPGVCELVQVSDGACPKDKILKMEMRIFRHLNYSIGRPPAVQFLRRFCRTAQLTTLIYALSKYIVDLALVQYKFCHLPPSLLAAAGLYVALYVKNDEPTDEGLWTPTLMFFSDYTVSDLKPIAPHLAKIIIDAPKKKQQSVRRLYGDQKKQLSVSMRPEVSSEKLLALARSAS